MTNLIFLYGPPGAGKLTIAKELSILTGYKLFHNHLALDLVCSVFDFKHPSTQKLSSEFRLRMFEEAAKAEVPGIIFTFVYANPINTSFVDSVIETVENNGGKVFLVRLTCKIEELKKRVTDESRKNTQKIKDAATLDDLFKQYTLDKPYPNRESLEIDTMATKPTDAARIIAEISTNSPKSIR